MFRQPIAMKAPALGMLREIKGMTKGKRRIATGNDGTKIEDGERDHRCFGNRARKASFLSRDLAKAMSVSW